MGHYASEMLEPRKETEAEGLRRKRARDLADQGYVFAAPYQDPFGGRSRVWSGPYWSSEGQELLHHKPCGLAVFDEVVHRDLCPVNQG